MRSVHRLFPIVDNEAWGFYTKQRDAFWFPAEIAFGEDSHDLQLMNKTEKSVLLNILGFFASADSVVNEKLFLSLYTDASNSEICMFYSMQIAIEAVHQETYNLLLDTLVKSHEEKDRLFNSIETLPCIKAKAKWYDIESIGCLSKRLFVQAIVEGIFFSASFAYIYWIKQKFPGKFKALSQSNQLIARDEGLHRDFAVMLYKRNPLAEDEVNKLIKSAVSLEHDFIINAFNGDGCLGLNSSLLCNYVGYVADHLLKSAGHNAIWNHNECPLQFMEAISLDTKTNFFETRATEYRLPSDNRLAFDELF